jgi:predicted ATPase with chaperone activity
MPGESKSSPREIQNYLGRISGPLLDRIDMHIEVPPVKFREMSGTQPGETSAQIRERVIAARQRQHARFAGKPKVTCNARMRAFDICTAHNSCRKHQKNKAFLPSQTISARNQDHRRFAHGQAKTSWILT